MSELWGHLVGVIIVLMILVFLGIWVWAWRPRHKGQFQRLANIPMQDLADADHNSHGEKKS